MSLILTRRHPIGDTIRWDEVDLGCNPEWATLEISKCAMNDRFGIRSRMMGKDLRLSGWVD